uniref:MI domain-containing protein n=1 Tax=Timema poppense TaxID=170557 RepID=A0A7R9CTK2_TIMPO|nr:unnamed protein product [Timema poppensis]
MSKTHKEKYKSAFKDKNYGKKHSKSSKDDRPSEFKTTEDKESEDAWDVKKYSDKFRNKSPAEISPSVGSRYYGEHSKETNKDQLNLDDDIIEDRSRIAIDWEESEDKRLDERVNKGKKRREVDEDHYFIENTKNIRKRQKNTEEVTTEETTINKNDYYKNKSHEDNLEPRQEDQQNKNFVKRNSLISKNKQKKYEDETKEQSKIKRADYNIIEQYNERRAKGNKKDVIEVVENRLDKRTNEILFVNDEENEMNHGKNYKGKQKSFDPENKSYHETTSRDNEKYYSKETDYYREKRHNIRQRDNFFEYENHLNRRPRSSRNNFDENDSYPERRLYKDNENPDKRSSNEYQSKRPSRSSGDSEKEYSRGSNFHHERRPGQVKEKHMPHKERFDDRNQMARRKCDSEMERIKSPSGEKRKNMTNLSGNNIKDSTLPARDPAVITSSQKKTVDLLTSKTGGAYIPPAKLRMMQAQITDKSSAAYQRIAWEALKKSIHGHINKINTSNIGIIVRELFKENVVRGRGLLCRSIIQAQAASPTFTHVYAALVAVINTKFPNIGELLLKRLVIQFRRGFKRNDKSICISAATFIAHLVNQRVAHEIIALEILTLLVESPTDDSVEVAIAFLKECGMKLMEVSKNGVHAIFEMLRNILHEGQLDKRVQYMIEVIFQVRKDMFRDHEAIIKDLDLVEEADQFTHLITLDEATDPDDILNVFKFDAEYEATEARYLALRKEILDEGSGSSGDESGSESGSDEDESGNEEAADTTILDNTETNLVALRRTIYLTIHSSLDFEECAHKLMRMELKPGQEMEMCHMFLDCCAEQRTYEKFFGLLAQRFCQINRTYIPPFQQILKDTYDTIHRLDTNKLRNVAKFFAHLLFTDAISWEVLSFIRLNEEETTSSSRIFIKILFQELSEYMGLTKLNNRVKDPTLQMAFDGLFPRDNPKNTRFAINFFTSIGLGGLTDELREHLKSQPKALLVPQLVEALGSGSNDSENSSDDSSSDSSSESEPEPNKKDKRKKSKSSKKESSGKSKKSKHKKKKSKSRKKKKKI